ncbi:hypothetical protein, partial [Shigella sonnei]|uniref:hypothetical protein n=1 Tax=Shigella sonnei TaxID=624 RepID=UPI001C0A9186
RTAVNTKKNPPTLWLNAPGPFKKKTHPPRAPGFFWGPPRREKTSEARQFFRHQVSKQSFKPGNSFSFLHQK